MVNSFGDTYSTGTMSLDNGATTMRFVGSLLTTQAEIGDMVYVNNLLIYVSAVTDDTHLETSVPWGGSTLTGVAYTLLKWSKARYDPALTQAKLREMLTFFEGIGFFYFVSGTVPDPSVGIDGQWALKTNSGDWKVWYHTGGAWVLQSPPSGLDMQGIWSSIVTYTTGQVASYSGALWASIVDGNINHQPDISPSQWVKVLSGGDQYDVQFFDTDRPASGELVNKAYPKGVTFLVGLAASYATAEIASTGTVHYSFQKNGVEFATLTFSPGNVIGVFACPTQTAFTAASDKLTMIAPASRDATLSGVGGNLVGFR